MASLELLVLITLAMGVVAYLGGKLHKVVGAILTIFTTGFVFVSVAYYGFGPGLDVTVNYVDFLTFELSYFSIRFSKTALTTSIAQSFSKIASFSWNSWLIFKPFLKSNCSSC